MISPAKKPRTILQSFAAIGHNVRTNIGPAGEDFDAFFDRLYAGAGTDQVIEHARGNRPAPGSNIHKLATHDALVKYWATRWADFGFNCFELTPSLAAGLMLTQPAVKKTESVEELHLPFPAFALKLPEGVIPLFNGADPNEAKLVPVEGQRWARFLCVGTYSGEGESWFRYMAGEWDTTEYDGVAIWAQGPIHTFPQCSSGAALRIHLFDDEPAYTEQDDISHACIWNLVQNFASWATTPSGVHELSRKPAPTKAQRDHKGAWPTYWVFGRDVKLSKDLRNAAMDFVLSGSRKPREGWKLRSQHVVRGHMKRQHYGEERKLVKDIWVEPYWRGPESGEAWAHLYRAGEGGNGK